MPHSTATASRKRRNRSQTAAQPSASTHAASDATPSAPRTTIGATLLRRYLNRREAAAYLGFSVEHLIDLVRSKQIAEHDFGRFVKRYSVDDLEAFAKARRNAADAAALLG